MTLSVTHSYVSSVGETTPSGGPGGTVGPTEWNATHTLSGTVSPAQGGTGITSGLGVTYFSSATVIADSGTLGANQLIVGGGANGAPAAIGSLGTTSQVLHGNASGNPSFGSVDLGSQVSGTLPVAQGGTNSSTIGSSGQVIFNNSGGLAGMSGTSWDNTNLALTIAGATVTASNPILNLSQTLNAGAVVFTALKLNVTNTASAAASLLMDLQVGGSSQFNVAVTGNTAVNAAGYINSTNNGFLINGGGSGLWASSLGITLLPGHYFSWAASNPNVDTDTKLYRDAAGIVAQRNGVNAQTLRVYNTFTDASNYERGVFDWTTSSNVLTIGTQAGGTGTARNITISAAGPTIINKANNGTAVFANTYDASANRFVSVAADTFLGFTTGAPGSNVNTESLYHVAVGVIGFTLSQTANSPAPSGWMQWGGQARVTANVTSTTTSLANITGLTATLANGRNYSFACEVIGTCSSSGGVQLALNTTSTSTGYTLLIDGYAIDGGNSVRGYSQQTAVGTAVIASTITNTSFHASLWGTITTSSSMVVNFQMAQQNLSATQTIAQRGSYAFFHDMP